MGMYGIRCEYDVCVVGIAVVFKQDDFSSKTCSQALTVGLYHARARMHTGPVATTHSRAQNMGFQTVQRSIEWWDVSLPRLA